VPAVIGEEMSHLKTLDTNPGKTLVKDEDVDMFLRGDVAREDLGNPTHPLTLPIVPDPKRPIHHVILHNRELGDAVSGGGRQVNVRNLTQHFLASEAWESIARRIAAEVVEAKDVTVLRTRGTEGCRAKPDVGEKIRGRAPVGGHQQYAEEEQNETPQLEHPQALHPDFL
jgi:hypothetical protein